MLYLGGQTIYLGNEKKAAIFLTKKIEEDDKYIKNLLYLYDGNEFFDHSGNGVSHIFKDDTSKLDRTLYLGQFCNMSLHEPAYEADLKDKSKDVKKYLKDVLDKINKKTLFTKIF